MQTGDTAEEGGDERAASSLRGVESVLVLSDSMDPGARASYYETLLPDDPSRLHVLGIEYTRGPDGWLDEWREHVGRPPAETAVVSVNDATRSAASSVVGPTTYEGDGTGSAVSTVESPDDLTGLGIAVGEHLKRWEGSAEPTLVTLDSLTVLLGYVDLKRTFRFLHVMVNRVKGAGGVGHYHMDPAAHDDRTVATLASVFDAVARHEDGEWRVSTR
ncbi:MAG: hypothetical protein V5A62_02090 [Haloarculaceae archaeon]